MFSLLKSGVTARLSRQKVFPARGSFWRGFVGGGEVRKAESVGSVQAILSWLVWWEADAHH